jgi:hypothetical protein
MHLQQVSFIAILLLLWGCAKLGTKLVIQLDLAKRHFAYKFNSYVGSTVRILIGTLLEWYRDFTIARAPW